MNRCSLFGLSAVAMIGFTLLAGGNALAQQKQQVSFKVPAENSKYTQQQFLDVGDTPDHQVRSLRFTAPFRPTHPSSTE